MALPFQSSPFFKKPHPLLHTPFHSITKPKFTLISKDSSTDNNDPTIEPTSITTPSKKPLSPGQGFGSSSQLSAKSTPSPSTSKKKQKGKRERAAIVRRTPVEKPAFFDKKDEKQGEEEYRNESGFLLAWLGLGALILVEGIALAASGFLPEEWDKFFVKYLYPSFTPMVFLFVAGTVVYGLFKYLQNENPKNLK